MIMLTDAVGVLEKVKPFKNGAFMACCPAHQDKNPSLVISEKDGRIHVHCFAGCQWRAIADAFAAKGVNIEASTRNTYVSIDPEQVEFRLPRNLTPKFDLADEIPESLNVGAVLQDARMKDAPLVDAVIPIFRFLNMDTKKREDIISPFLMTSSLNMLFAPPGLGKTWLALHMAVSVAGGTKFLAYDVPRKFNVLLVDGEMLMSDLQKRLNLLGAEKVAHFDILPSELLRDDPLNIMEPIDQDRINQALQELEAQGRRPDLIIFDNLSSLARGVDENDNSELDTLLRWLIDLRHAGFAIMLIHHSGKSGQQRGASRREDLLDTIIRLSRLDEDQTQHGDGAHFKLDFTKNRGMPPKPFELEVMLRKNSAGKFEFSYQSVSKKGTADMQVLLHIEQETPAKQKDIAVALDCTAANISTAVKALVGKGYLPQTKELKPTEKGMEALRREFPEIYSEANDNEIPF